MASRNYDQLFPTAHKWLGHIDLFGRRNVMGGVVHLSMVPTEKWKVKLDAHTLMRLKNTDGLSSIGAAGGAQLMGAGTGLTTVNGGTSSTSKFAGEEIDFTVSYKAMKHLSFASGVSVFVPFGFIKNNIDNEMPLFGWVQAVAKF